MDRNHERSREEEERLHKEVGTLARCPVVKSVASDLGDAESLNGSPSLQNSRYREEVLELGSRNSQLSNDNAELSARLCGERESVRMLQERLEMVSKHHEEEGALVRLIL